MNPTTAQLPEPTEPPELLSPPIPETFRYNMTVDQTAQIDCRYALCPFNVKAKCTNASPAISLGAKGNYVCWTERSTRPA